MCKGVKESRVGVSSKLVARGFANSFNWHSSQDQVGETGESGGARK